MFRKLPVLLLASLVLLLALPTLAVYADDPTNAAEMFASMNSVLDAVPILRVVLTASAVAGLALFLLGRARGGAAAGGGAVADDGYMDQYGRVWSSQADAEEYYQVERDRDNRDLDEWLAGNHEDAHSDMSQDDLWDSTPFDDHAWSEVSFDHPDDFEDVDLADWRGLDPDADFDSPHTDNGLMQDDYDLMED